MGGLNETIMEAELLLSLPMGPLRTPGGQPRRLDTQL